MSGVRILREAAGAPKLGSPVRGESRVVKPMLLLCLGAVAFAAKAGECPATGNAGCPVEVAAASAEAPAAAAEASAYVPKTPYDNTPYRFDMSQQGKRMSAADFEAWMQARGLRVATGKPTTAAAETADAPVAAEAVAAPVVAEAAPAVASAPAAPAAAGAVTVACQASVQTC